ncbi:hypothetical protein [Bacillus infantis]|jgi:hypothetical protein|uniref:hypothetical protein n=1 Tax=Bacillus infantis TaxID=324767 RepID=UPI00209EA4AF|nr:hypothetical protein [Bacillus infantis]MCP1156690.1 hypothetical protein [Bacillus infantis]
MQKVNVWSFIFSIICFLLFMEAAFSGPIDDSLFGLDPLEILLYLTLAAFVVAVMGFGGIQNRMGLVRSVASLAITLGLSGFLAYIVFFGKLLS